MVTARMYLDTDGFYHKFDVSGHADGYTDDSEYDLVCAAISSITLTIASGLQDVLHKEGSFHSESGFLIVSLVSYRDNETQALMKTLQHGLEIIQTMYPDKLKLESKEG